MASETRIVKSDRLCRSVWASPARVVRRDVSVARTQAAEIVENAKASAAAIVKDAEARRSEVREAARQEGYEEGLRQWNDILLAAANRSDELVRRNETDLVKLAVRMAEKIVGERLKADPATMVGIVAEALKSVRRERSLTIQVHPSCVDLIRDRVGELQSRAGGGREIWIEPNTSVEPGGCIVESDVGVIDARLETQLRCLERVLLQAGKK